MASKDSRALLLLKLQLDACVKCKFCLEEACSSCTHVRVSRNFDCMYFSRTSRV